MQKQKGVSTLIGLIIIIAVAVVAFGGVFGYQYLTTPKEINTQENPTACTLEAKVCPDGSSVGHTGPNCEFAECPSAQDQTTGWKTYRDAQYGYSINYPSTWYLKKDTNASGAVQDLAFSNYPDELNPQEDLYLFGMNIYTIDAQTTYDDILSGYKPYSYEESQNIDIDGLKAIKLTKITDEFLIKSQDTYKSTNTFIFLKSGTRLFVFTYSYDNPYSGKSVAQDKIDTAEKIISTFGFIR